MKETMPRSQRILLVLMYTVGRVGEILQHCIGLHTPFLGSLRLCQHLSIAVKWDARGGAKCHVLCSDALELDSKFGGHSAIVLTASRKGQIRLDGGSSDVLKVDRWSAGKHERTNVEEVLGSSLDTDKNLALDGKRDYDPHIFLNQIRMRPLDQAATPTTSVPGRRLSSCSTIVQAMFAGSSMTGGSFEVRCRILTSSMLGPPFGWIHSSSSSRQLRVQSSPSRQMHPRRSDLFLRRLCCCSI
jgi:hypothetical protein